MSDLAPGSLSLEENQSEQISETPPPAPETPPETPQSAAPEPDQDPEGTVVNPGGEKLVPLSVVADLRGKVRAEKEAREKEQAELAELRTAKQQLETIKGDWNRVQPLIQQLQNGHLQPPPPPKPQVNEKALQYARDLDLYKPDGTPDVDRAQRILDYNAAQAQETARQLVQPIYQQTAQQQSRANFTAAVNFKDKNGVQVDKAILERVWGMMPAEMSANPEIAGVLYKIAVAEMVQQGAYKTPVQAPPPPIVTESLGGNTSQPRELSAIDRSMATAANIKTKDYESISANFKPGQTNALE